MTDQEPHTMRITLAYPYQGHQPDETIEVSDAEGQTLIGDGWARTADADPDVAPPADDNPVTGATAPSKGASRKGTA